mmetsp:Transcript_41336/g.67999  ORF Transcript_41336/g.67999 Transcript_41336/m.67999 type:complete len:201 (-) Transcript_41336:104-706(-)
MKQQLSKASDEILSGDWDTLTAKMTDVTLARHADPDYKETCLLLCNLRYDVTKTHVTRFVSRVAQPISVVMSSYESGRHIGKCYVAFDSPQTAHNVMAELNGNLLLARPVIMLFAPIESMEDDTADADGKNASAVSREIQMKAMDTEQRLVLIDNDSLQVEKEENHQDNAYASQAKTNKLQVNENDARDKSNIVHGILVD